MKTIGRFRSREGRTEYVQAYNAAMATLPSPTDSFDIRTSLGHVHGYRWAGSDDEPVPVALLPGRSAGVPMWRHNLADLLRCGRTFFAMDALGDAGLSEQSAPLSTLADLATWVEETFHGLGVDRVHTLGHSFGAATAALHALHHPERVATLALLEPVFVLRCPPPSSFLWTTLSVLPGPTSWRDHALAALGGVDVEDVRARTPIGEMISAGAQHFVSALPTPRPFSSAQLQRLPMPTYVAIASRRSQARGRRAAARAATLPDATVDVWPDTTHSLPMQVPTEVAHRLDRFWDHEGAGDPGLKPQP